VQTAVANCRDRAEVLIDQRDVYRRGRGDQAAAFDQIVLVGQRRTRREGFDGGRVDQLYDAAAGQRRVGGGGIAYDDRVVWIKLNRAVVVDGARKRNRRHAPLPQGNEVPATKAAARRRPRSTSARGCTLSSGAKAWRSGPRFQEIADFFQQLFLPG